MANINFSDHRIRSGTNFIVFLLFVFGVSLFILKKTQDAINEIGRLSDMPAVSMRRDVR